MANPGQSEPLISILMMDKPAMRSAKTFCASIQQWLPQLPASIVSEDREKAIWILKVGPYDVYLALIPGPIPWSQLESLAKAAWHWKEAPQLLPNHKAQLLITVMKGPPNPLDGALLLTKITGAVLEVQEALGVYWHGPAISPKKLFIEEAKTSARGQKLPVLCWMSFNIIPSGPQYVISTQGMNRLGCMELDMWANRGTSLNAVEFSLDMAAYVLNGAVLKHGETFGRTANERFRITHGPWALDRTKAAIVLDLRAPAR